MEMPQKKFIKLVLNTTSQSVVHEKQLIIRLLVAMELISGRRPKRTFAKKSVASFQVRQGQCVGCKVTLRGKNMFNFLEKCRITILPRLRNFQRFRDSISGSRKSLNFGIDHLLIFPELENNFELFEQVKGVNISIIVTSSTVEISGRSDNDHMLTYFV